MISNTSKYRILFGLCLLMLCLSACTHKELCYPNFSPKVKIIFDWSKAKGSERPAAMSVWLFPKQGGEPIRYDFADIRGNEVPVPVGDYYAVCVNKDLSNDHWEMETDRDHFSMVAGKSSLLAPIGVNGNPKDFDLKGQEVVLPNDPLWSDAPKFWFTIRGDVKDQEIRLFPQDINIHYSVEIRGVKNIGSLQMLGAALDGMSPCYSLSHGKCIDKRAIIPFEMRRGKDDVLRGDFLTFGASPDADGTHTLTLFVVLTDGTKKMYTFDVTDQVKNAPDEEHVHLILDGLDLPAAINAESGFEITVDDWGVVINEDLQM